MIMSSCRPSSANNRLALLTNWTCNETKIWVGRWRIHWGNVLEPVTDTISAGQRDLGIPENAPETYWIAARIRRTAIQ
jgi:hypothetical protein